MLADGQVPSLSVAVARGENVVLEKTYGRADIENDVPAGNATIYRIASITKQFTAAAVLRLVEQGRVDLDADLLKYIPEFHSQGRAITVRQLLNHTSGIQSLTEVPKYVPKERLDLTDAEILETFQDEPPHFRPGENFLYNNSGFYLLGMMIERVTGQSYADHFQQSIFNPLSLKSTSVCDEVSVVRHRAHGYIFNNGRPPQNAPFISSAGPKGGGNLCSTAHDLVLWARALTDGKVVSPQSYALMATPGALSDGRPIGYGLGVFLSEMEGRPEVFHGGDFYSFTAFLAWYPADDVTVAVLQNSNAAPAFTGHLARQIARRLLELPEPQLAETALDGNELTRVSGTYRIGHASIEVRREGADLVLASDRVWQLAGHTFRYFGGGVFRSIRNPDLQAQFGAGSHAPTLSLTLHGRAIGDAARQGNNESGTPDGAVATQAPRTGTPSSKILFVGNSLTFYNEGVYTHLEKLMASGTPPVTVWADKAVVGGAYFKSLWEVHPEPRQAIARGYDIVVLQEDLPETTVADFRAYAPRFVEAIRKTGARPVLTMAWAYRRLGWISADQIAQAHRELGKELGVDVAPVGIAWERVMKERPDVNLFDPDFEHPNIHGTYLSTLVVYATVFRKDPMALSYAPLGVTPDVATFLKRVAWETVRDFSQ